MLYIIIAVAGGALLILFGKVIVPLLLLLLPLWQRWQFIAMNGWQAYRYWQRYRGGKPAATSTAMTRQQALDILALKEPFTKDDVEGAYRHLSKRVHPDVGGNDYFMRLITQARDVLIK